MAGELRYTLGLATAPFLGPLSQAAAGLTGFIGLAGGLGGILAAIFAQVQRGAALRDLANQTGESVQALFQLERAFKIVGGDPGSVPRVINAMQRALGGVNETGEPTGKIFEQIGLEIELLKAQDAPTQIQLIANALAGLDRASAASAAGKIFGRGLSADILKAARDSEDFARTLKESADAGARLERNAAAFDRIDDALARIKFKISDVFAGLAEASLGFLEAFKSGQATELISLAIQAGAEKGLTFLSTLMSDPRLWSGLAEGAKAAFISASVAIASVLRTPLAFVEAVIERVNQFGGRLIEEQESFETIFARKKAENALIFGLAPDIIREQFGLGSKAAKNLGDALGDAFKAAKDGPAGAAFSELLGTLIARAQGAPIGGAGGRAAAIDFAFKSKKEGEQDPFTRIGFAGGLNAASEALQAAKQTANNTREQLRALYRMNYLLERFDAQRTSGFANV